MTKKRAVICLYGVVPRSIKYTINSIKENVINVLEEYFYVSIYVFNMNVENEVVDDTILDQNDIKLIQFNYFEEKKQKDFDLELSEKQKKFNLTFRSNYTSIITQNALRQLYSEYRVGKFLENNNYDFAIAFSSDFFFANKLNIDDCLNSYGNTNILYGSIINEGQGFSNGFFFGNPKPLATIMKRFEKIESYLPINGDYEYLLKLSFERNNISRKITNIIIFKIRANKKIFGWPNNNYKSLCNISEIDKIYNNIFL